MKVLVAGLGSIGQRHVRNLRAKFGDRVDIIAHRVRGLPHVITESMTLDGDGVERRYGVRRYARLDEALQERPDAAFICNPSSRHMESALAAARAGCHLFIEKPLSHSAAGVDELIDVVKQRNLVATVGYQMRFHPALIRLRQLLGEGAIGAVVSVQARFGEYLPGAHPYEDYRQSYAARAALGGGVILCYIHEIDYLCWLFGTPHRIVTAGGRLGDLDVDVEDTAITRFEFAWCGRTVPVLLEQSFLQRPARRCCDVIGEQGSIHVDLLAPALVLSSPAVSTREVFDGFQRNQLFQTELDDFFGAIAGTNAAAVPLADAARSLRVALAMRESLASGHAVELAA